MLSLSGQGCIHSQFNSIHSFSSVELRRRLVLVYDGIRGCNCKPKTQFYYVVHHMLVGSPGIELNCVHYQRVTPPVFVVEIMTKRCLNCIIKSLPLSGSLV